jgi:PAS domain S-box-containing protein
MSNESSGSRGPTSGSVEWSRDEHFKALIQHSFDVIALVGSDATVEYVSPSVSRVLGYSPDEFVGLNGFEQIHPDDVEGVRRRFEEVLEAPGASLEIETRLRHKDGSCRWVESRITNLLRDPTARAIVLNVRDLTERKLAEEDLKRKQEELTDFVENATVGLHWVGPDGTILWANRAELDLLGYTREEYVGRNIAEFHADPPVIADILKRLTTGEELHSYEARLRCKDGSIRCVLMSSNVYSKDGKFIHTRCFTRDITERKRLEEEVFKQREYWRVALSSIGDATMLTDTDGLITFMNPVAESLCGWPQAEAIGKPLRDVFRIVNEKTRQPVESPVEKVLRDGHIVGLANHTVLIARDAKEIPIDDSAAPIIDERGNVSGVVLVFRDITEKRRAEELKEWLAAIVESSDDIIVSKTLDGIITSWNKGAERTLGYTAEEVIGKHVSMLMPPEQLEDTTKILGSIRRGQTVDHYETKRRRKDGTIIDVSLTVSPIRNEEGEIIGASKVGRDITEAKRAAELKDRLAAIVESSDDIIVSKTLDGIITSWNKGAERTLGYTAEEVIGKHVSMLMPPEQLEDTTKILGKIRRGEKVDHYETKRRRKNGTIIDVSLTVSPIRDASGQIIGASKIGRDITREKLIEAERLEAERRKDEFLAMLAHELRNPLSAINGAAQLFGKLETEEELEWAKEVVQRQVRHLARLIDDLLDVSRISRGKISLRKEPLNLSPIVSSAVEAVRPLMEERKHELSISLINGGLRLEADPLRLEQIFVNLLTNSAKYTDAGGRISLTARHEGTDIVIKVQDNGMGITPDLMPRIFDLFTQGDRTMARSEGGLGIGLTLVQKLAEMHGGSVTAASEGPGKGSEFTVRLPALEEPAAQKSSPKGTLPRVARQSSRVLVVDDNHDNARGLSKLLTLLGHDVRVAHDGNEAIKEAHAHCPEIVLLDIGLPGMDGYEVARRLRQEAYCRDSLIIAVSGYGQPEDLRRSKEAGFDHHLVKPVDYDALMTLFAPQSV